MKFHRLIVEVDGSRESAAAVQWCADHTDAGDEVIATAAMSLFGELMLSMPPSDLLSWQGEVRHGLEHAWTEPLRERKVLHHVRMDTGTPWKALLEAAAAERAEAIVVGQHRGHLFNMSNESDRIAHHSSIPVIVVPLETATQPTGGAL